MATAGDPLVPLDPAATRLEAPAGATVDADGTVVVVPGEGRYELDRTAGAVLFTPEPAFAGTATPVPYVVTDAAGATTASTLTPSATEVARPDTSIGEQGTPQRLPVTENDGGAVPVSPATLRLVDPSGIDTTTVMVPAEVPGRSTPRCWSSRPSPPSSTRRHRCRTGSTPPQATRSSRRLPRL